MAQRKETKKIKVRDLKPKKDAKGGGTHVQGGTHQVTGGTHQVTGSTHQQGSIHGNT
jgi:hypothetical protein